MFGITKEAFAQLNVNQIFGLTVNGLFLFFIFLFVNSDKIYHQKKMREMELESLKWKKSSDEFHEKMQKMKGNYKN